MKARTELFLEAAAEIDALPAGDYAFSCNLVNSMAETKAKALAMASGADHMPVLVSPEREFYTEWMSPEPRSNESLGTAEALWCTRWSQIVGDDGEVIVDQTKTANEERVIALCFAAAISETEE